MKYKKKKFNMEIKRKINIQRNFCKINLSCVEILLKFLNLDEIIELLKISKNLNLIVKNTGILSSLQKVISYIKNNFNDTKIPSNDQNEISKIELQSKNSDILKSDTIDIYSNLNNPIKKIRKNILNKLTLTDLIKNEATFIKNAITNLKLNNQYSISVFGYIFEKLYKKESSDNYSITKKTSDDCSNKNRSNLSTISSSKQPEKINKPSFIKYNNKNIVKVKNITTQQLSQGKIDLKNNSFVCTNFGLGENLVYFSHFFLLNSAITHIDLSHNKLNSKSISYLSKSIRYNKNLKVLILKNNKISNSGCKNFFKFLNSWNENIKLSHLDISNNEIGSDGVDTLSEFLKNTKTLFNLNISYNLIGSLGASILKNGFLSNKSIKILNISYNGLCSEGINQLKDYFNENKILQTLNIGGNYLLEEGSESLSEIIKINKSIKTIFIDNSNINSAKSTSSIAESLNSNKSISNFDITNNDLDKISFLRFIEILDPENSNIRTLNLSYNNFGSDGIKILGNFLAKNKSIILLNLEGNFIGPEEGSKIILEILLINKTIKELNISSCSIGTGLCLISEAFKDNKSIIENFNLGNNDIGDKEIEVFCGSLVSNTILVNLQLNKNKINDSGAEALSNLLKRNFTISILNLEGNTISSKGAKTILKSLNLK